MHLALNNALPCEVFIHVCIRAASASCIFSIPTPHASSFRYSPPNHPSAWSGTPGRKLQCTHSVWPLLHRERHRHHPAFLGNPLGSSLRFLGYSSPLPRDDAFGREKIQEGLKCFAFKASQAQSQSYHAKTCPISITTYAHKPLKQMSSRGKLI